jgi:hypothetical protein
LTFKFCLNGCCHGNSIFQLFEGIHDHNSSLTNSAGAKQPGWQ